MGLALTELKKGACGSLSGAGGRVKVRRQKSKADPAVGVRGSPEHRTRLPSPRPLTHSPKESGVTM